MTLKNPLTKVIIFFLLFAKSYMSLLIQLNVAKNNKYDYESRKNEKETNLCGKFWVNNK